MSIELADLFGVDVRRLRRLAKIDPDVAAHLARATGDPAFAARLAAEIERRRPIASPTAVAGTPVIAIDPGAYAAPINAFARDVLAFEPSPGQATILAQIYRDNIVEAVLRIGRRGGKGRIAAVVATYEATVNAAAHLAAVPAGEQVAIVVVATSQKQARTVHRYIRSFLRRPALAGMIAKDTDDEIELSNGITILCVPCSAATARGMAAAVVILDEAAWFVGRDGSPIDVKEIADALFPATAQFPQGRRIVLSTPRWPFGWFYELCKRADSGEFPDMRHWHATTADMNPKITAAFLERERRKDPIGFQREYLAEFTDVSDEPFLEAVAVDAAIRDAPLWRPPVDGPMRVAALDPAFTAGADAFAMAIGWRDEQDTLVVAGVEAWRGHRSDLDVEAVLDAVAGRCREYGVSYAVTDQGFAAPVVQGLEKRGMTVIKKPLTSALKWDICTALRTGINTGRIELPPHPNLRRELVSLTLSVTPSGRPAVRAPARSSAHDDLAMAVATLAYEIGNFEGVLLHV